MESKEDIFHLGVKAFIRNSEGKVLLLERQRKSKDTYWDIPGGRMQKGETMLEALHREIEEETGLKNIDSLAPLSMHLTNIRIPILDNDVGLIFSIYKCDVFSHFTPQLSDEHINFGWFNISEAVELLKQHYSSELIDDLKKLLLR